jgi:hypothetical protein
MVRASCKWELAFLRKSGRTWKNKAATRRIFATQHETWCISVVKFKDLEELRGLYGEKEGIKVNRLEISDGKFYYDIDVDTLSDDSSFSVLTDIKWSLELPGTPIGHNADQVEGDTLTWSPTPKSGVINLHAESEVPRGGFPSCGAAFLGIGAALLYWNRRGRKFSHQ